MAHTEPVEGRLCHGSNIDRGIYGSVHGKAEERLKDSHREVAACG